MTTPVSTSVNPADYPVLADPYFGKAGFVQNLGTTTFGVSTAYNAIPFSSGT